MKSHSQFIRLPAIITLIILIIGCNNSSSSSKNNSGTVDTIKTIVDITNSNTIAESKIKPYSEVDSLTGDLRKVFSFRSLLKLDSICTKSDGDLTEKYYGVTKYLFTAHLLNFIDFMLKYPNCCLKNNLIEGISAELSIFEGDNRVKEIRKSKDKTLRQAKDSNFSTEQIQVIKDVYDKINPELFD